jgi:hypothetical protein
LQVPPLRGGQERDGGICQSSIKPNEETEPAIPNRQKKTRGLTLIYLCLYPVCLLFPSFRILFLYYSCPDFKPLKEPASTSLDCYSEEDEVGESS